MLVSPCPTWIDLLHDRARSQSDKTAFVFLKNGESETDSLTYGQLERRSPAIAAYLQSFLARGDRALLLYPPGLDFIRRWRGKTPFLSGAEDGDAPCALTSTFPESMLSY